MFRDALDGDGEDKGEDAQAVAFINKLGLSPGRDDTPCPGKRNRMPRESTYRSHTPRRPIDGRKEGSTTKAAVT